MNRLTLGLATCLLPAAAWANSPVWVPERTPDTQALAPVNTTMVPEPAEASDQVFVADDGPGLDTGCQFSNEGDLVISLGITRALSESVDSNGRPTNLQYLIDQGWVDPTVRIRMPAFDVDSDANVSGVAPEVDEVFLNGKKIGEFAGENNQWNIQEFRAHIADLRFPAAGDPIGSPAQNEIRIKIDTGNPGNPTWCTAVAWVEIEIAAQSPLLLVHGINASETLWDEIFDELSDSNVALPRERFSFSGSPGTPDNSLISSNIAKLADQLAQVRQRWGVDGVHIVAHSKGGLDTRGYLGSRGNSGDTKIRSLFTISTPHRGSVMADITTNYIDYDVLPDGTPLAFRSFNWLAYGLGVGEPPRLPGLRDLRTDAMANFNAETPPPPRVPFYSIHADADLNGDGFINQAEQSPLFDALPFSEETVATTTYGFLRTFRNARVILVDQQFGAPPFTQTVQIPDSVEVVNTALEPNDLAVSRSSSRLPGIIVLPNRNANHSTVLDGTTAQTILNRIRLDFPLGTPTP